MIRSFFLVIRADGTERTMSRKPRGLRWDEVAYRVNVTVPDAWGEIRGEINLAMPEPPAAALVPVEE